MAAQDYPQCALVGVGSGLPVPAQLVTVGSAVLEWRGKVYELTGPSSPPPLGLNTWNAFHTNVDENLVLAVGKAFVDLGLAAVGWEYVNVVSRQITRTRVAQALCPD